MNISFTGPLDQAWLRMKVALLQPFNLGKWFVLGFTAWLASLAGSGPGNGVDGTTRFSDNFHDSGMNEWTDATAESFREFLSHGIAGMFIAMLIVLALVLFVAALWISSRGKFMFLDNLVHDRAEVRRPWHEFRQEGDALFVWQLVFILAILAVFGALALAGFLVLVPLGAADASAVVMVPLAILAGTAGFILLVALIYIQFFLDHFVVTIMYRERIGVNAAWSRFLMLLRAYPGSFVVYGLFYLLIMIVGGLVYFLGGLLTCCVGLLLLALPYVGAVLTLPLSVLGRYWDLEFLAQFGDDFRVPGSMSSPRRSPAQRPVTTPMAVTPIDEISDPEVPVEDVPDDDSHAGPSTDSTGDSVDESPPEDPPASRPDGPGPHGA